MTTFGDRLYQMGGTPVGTLLFNQGDTFFVDPTNGSDSNTGKKVNAAKLTFAAGENALTAGKNETLYYLNGTSSLSFSTSTVTWDKDYTHYWGVGAPTMVAQRSRMFNSGNAAIPLITISAKGCSFGNLYWFDGSAAATARCCDVTGSRNYFYRVHFAGLGHATASAGTASCALKLTGDENTFEECVIGVDTIKRTGDNAIMFLDSAATRNIFKKCIFVSWAETNSYPIIELTDTTSADRYTIFEDCIFYNFWTNHADKLTEVFTIPASSQTHDIILKDCLAVGADEWEQNDRGQIWVHNAGGAATSGIALAPAL